MECCGPEQPSDEWDHSCVHPETVAYSCGRLYCPGQPNRHDHDPDELQRCRNLADDAAKLMEGVTVNLSESTCTLAPFYITANRGDEVPKSMTKTFLTDMFNHTIYPAADIEISPLAEGNAGWEAFAVSDEGFGFLSPAERKRLQASIEFTMRENAKRAERWRELFRWFESHDNLFAASFVQFGTGKPMSKTNLGCVFPRLVAAITSQGSLVGVMGHAVHT